MLRRMLLGAILVGGLLAGFLHGAETATMRMILKSGDVQTRSIPLREMAENHHRLVIAPKEILPETQTLEVYADFATARKGEEGYWISPRGVYGKFHQDNGEWRSPPMIPIYGMKTPRRTFLAHMTGMELECSIGVRAKDGNYTLFQQFPLGTMYFPPYEDIVVDFYTLIGDDANYSGMGRLYRKIQLDCGAVRPIRKRIASGESPWLEYLCDAMTVRIHHASKPYRKERVDYTPETELPVRAVLPFEQAKEVIRQLKERGVDKMAICTAGWQSGGYDGRCPQSFPVEPVAGGEEKLKEYIAYAQSLGFQIDAHSNYTDTYTVFSQWSPDIVCRRKDGSLATNGVWCGGNAYNLCPRNAWETFFSSEMEKIGKLGFRGAHYIDVFSATYPYACCHPDHPCNRAEAAEYQRKMLQKAKSVFQGVASECGWDHVAGELDYINYVSRHMLTLENRPQPMVDGVVPLWEIVYHGIILANTDKLLQNKLDARKALRLVEFGGRPIFYSPNDQEAIAAAYEAFKPLRYLQKEFMESHEILAEGVARITYGDGSEILCNASENDFSWKGRTVKPLSYELYKPEGK
ncbi:MAG: DUF5696 domain-containing protein [Planctomycetia bacterium]|nr:DUF5696 domain-containing protein [Planctomycetia bacterium]